ncbi:mucin-3A-like [Homalodisca vitripennis]|uniref:mucin-3A-like n=1 Tax=Homalodisca vitripennis TaxID=197043 RepID=UPI001EEC9E1F|nr:mucin-3A-like [Homalodisca vitripennis]
MNPTIVVVFVIGSAQLLTATPVHRREIIADNRKQFYTIPEVLTTTTSTPHALMENINKALETTTILATDDELSLSSEESINIKPGSISLSSEVQDDSLEIKNSPPETSLSPPESSHSNAEDTIHTLGSTVFTSGELQNPNETTEQALDESHNKTAEPTVTSKVSSEDSETVDLKSSGSQPPYENLDLSSLQVSNSPDEPLSEAFQTTSEATLQLTELLFEDNPISATLISSPEDSTPSSKDSLSLDELFSSKSSTDTIFLATKKSELPFETTTHTPIETHISSEPLSETSYYTPKASESLSQDPISPTYISHLSQELYSEMSKISPEVNEPSSELQNLVSDPSSETPYLLNFNKTSDLPVTDIPESSTRASVTSSETLIPTYLYSHTPSDISPEISFPLSDISTDITSFPSEISFPLSEILHSSPERPSKTINSTSNAELEGSTRLSEDNTLTSTIQNFETLYPSSEILLTTSKDIDQSSSNLTLLTEGSNLSSEDQYPPSSTSEKPEPYFEDATSSTYIPNSLSSSQFSLPSSVFDSTTETPISLLETSVTSDMPISSYEDIGYSLESSSTISEDLNTSYTTSENPEQSFENATSSSYIPNTQFSSSSSVFDSTTETLIPLLETSVTSDMPISSYEELGSSYESSSTISEDLTSPYTTSEKPEPSFEDATSSTYLPNPLSNTQFSSSSSVFDSTNEIPISLLEASVTSDMPISSYEDLASSYESSSTISEGLKPSYTTSTLDNTAPSSSEANLVPSEVPEPFSEATTLTEDATDLFSEGIHSSEFTTRIPYPTSGTYEPTSGVQLSSKEVTFLEYFPSISISEPTSETLKTSSEVLESTLETFGTSSEILQTSTIFLTKSPSSDTSESITEYSSGTEEPLQESSKSVFSSITSKPLQDNSELTVSLFTTETSTLLNVLSSEISFNTSKTLRSSTEVPETTADESTDWLTTLAGHTTESSITEVSQSFESSTEMSTLIDIISSFNQTTEESTITPMDPVTTTSIMVTNSTDTKGTTAQVTTEPRNSGKSGHHFSVFLPLILVTFVSTAHIITWI